MDPAPPISIYTKLDITYTLIEGDDQHINISANDVLLGVIAYENIGPLTKFRRPAPLPPLAKHGIVYLQLSCTEENAVRFAKCNYEDIYYLAQKAIFQKIPKTIHDNVNLNTSDDSYAVSKLMDLTEEEWKNRDYRLFNGTLHLYFNQIEKFEQYSSTDLYCYTKVGFLEKHDLAPDSKIIVIGDIHGDDLRLVLTLKALQKRNILDQKFRCMPGKVLVFLGDYMDRGRDSLKVLELVVTLKMENPQQVHLLRGNHEDLETTLFQLEKYTSNDPKYQKYLANSQNYKILKFLYRSFPLAVYISQVSDAKVKEYMQFSHALFHIYTDPDPLLASTKKYDFHWILESKDFSSRIKQRMISTVDKIQTTKDQKLYDATLLLSELEDKIIIRFKDIYWLDIGKKFSEDPLTRRYTIPPEMTKAYLKLCSTDTIKIKEIMRGHQRGIWVLKNLDKCLVTTLDPTYLETRQSYMEINLAEKVCDWERTLVSFDLLDDHEKALEDFLEENSSVLCCDESDDSG